ncbi:hypothetical protein J6O48_03055 [bacterium]|nr:hypothetical protein [bacterium]
MNTKLIIIEGLDNTGKTTLINRLTKVFDLTNKIHEHDLSYEKITYKIIHMHKPPTNITDNDEANLYQQKVYNDIINELQELCGKYTYIFLDRAWLSEYVYGQLYRNRNKLEIVENNIAIENEILAMFNQNVYLLYLTADIEFIMLNEDGNSLSANDRDLITKETICFDDIFNMSLIYNKVRIPVCNANLEFIDILPKVYTYITF